MARVVGRGAEVDAVHLLEGRDQALAGGGEAARQEVDVHLANGRLAEGGGEHLRHGRELVDGAVDAVEVDGAVGGPGPLVGVWVRAVLGDRGGEEGRAVLAVGLTDLANELGQGVPLGVAPDGVDRAERRVGEHVLGVDLLVDEQEEEAHARVGGQAGGLLAEGLALGAGLGRGGVGEGCAEERHGGTGRGGGCVCM